MHRGIAGIYGEHVPHKLAFSRKNLKSLSFFCALQIRFCSEAVCGMSSVHRQVSDCAKSCLLLRQHFLAITLRGVRALPWFPFMAQRSLFCVLLLEVLACKSPCWCLRIAFLVLASATILVVYSVCNFSKFNEIDLIETKKKMPLLMWRA
ncbi:hypothetical protein NC651_003802 [Populus alba x Populus x berolinensis]|nr:hypothetical protein NC651_003802 [Populus alba x Populus x berolinensis]